MQIMRRSDVGDILMTVEEVEVLFPATQGGNPIDVTFDVQSPLTPGAAVYLTLTQPFPNILLLQTGAEVISVGSIHAQWYNAIDFAQDQTLPVHVLIAEHRGDP